MGSVSDMIKTRIQEACQKRASLSDDKAKKITTEYANAFESNIKSGNIEPRAGSGNEYPSLSKYTQRRKQKAGYGDRVDKPGYFSGGMAEGIELGEVTPLGFAIINKSPVMVKFFTNAVKRPKMKRTFVPTSQARQVFIDVMRGIK